MGLGVKRDGRVIIPKVKRTLETGILYFSRLKGKGGGGASG